MILRAQPPDLHPAYRQRRGHGISQGSKPIGPIIAVEDSALVEILVDPKLAVLLLDVAAEADPAPPLGDFLVDGVDEEVVRRLLAFVGCHEPDVGVDREHEATQIALVVDYVPDGPQLEGAEFVGLLF